ncbi:type IV secretory system conjugative DNA transfer family protein [Rhizobium leguminosarum]|uniref:type IV secretory system conjugative DNA transfer family protein n=1 Tax=Rhizobium leguminosarum TaxID=384 RepID=UPI001030072B|nr:type IV secretory system conjugative DNA transfer family protein [Rhizobium leguminosarum]TBG92657.1 type IV secretory system conjugative DNA transfer family protein [Rhizobium leguminosarum]
MDVLYWTFAGPWYLLVALCKLAWWLVRQPFRLLRFMRSRRGAHGSARWARRWEQWRKGAISGEGVILGRGAFRRLLRFSTDGLVMVFAATGAGKGLGVVIPSLLTYRGSMVVTDPKGENYAITRRHRLTCGKVRMLNPRDLVHSDRFNPMDMIRRGDATEADDAAALAALMVKPDARESHWDDKAAEILKALILHTLEEPPSSRTLATVRKLSTGARETFIETLQEIAEHSPSIAAREIASGAMTSAIDSDGNFSPEFGSILSNLQKATAPWSAGAPAGILSSSSTFQLTELLGEVSTLYLCVDEDLLRVYDRWLRVMVGCILNTLTRAKANRPKRKVVLLLDEAAVLGRMETLESQAGLLRAYCTPVLIWQNMPQITKVYGTDDAKAFLANASARVFFGINDNDTAHYVANMLGNATTISRSSGVSYTGAGNSSHQEGQSESGYWLLDASEVQRSQTRTIVKLRTVDYPILGRRIDYRKMWRWRGLWDKWEGTPPPGFNHAPAPPSDVDEDHDPSLPLVNTGSRSRTGFSGRVPS